MADCHRVPVSSTPLNTRRFGSNCRSPEQHSVLRTWRNKSSVSLHCSPNILQGCLASHARPQRVVYLQPAFGSGRMDRTREWLDAEEVSERVEDGVGCEYATLNDKKEICSAINLGLALVAFSVTSAPPVVCAAQNAPLREVHWC